MAPTSPRLLLLDGHSLAYRAFYALPVENFSTTTGAPTNAVYGFTSMLINAMRDEAPTHAAVCFDVSRVTFRNEAFPEYKANRSSTPDDFRPQVSLIREVLDALRIPSLAVEGYEADDLIATLARAAEAEGYEVLIVTGDRDAFQLVSDRVTVLYPKRGVSEMSRMDPAAVEERYGLTPRQYPDFAALRGDPSDNLPSVPGVGEKTAAKWIRDFGSLAALTDRVDEVPGKTGNSLREHLTAVLLNRQLTELRGDVPLDVVPADLALKGWDRDEVHRVFDTLQFRVLRERLWATLESATPEAEAGFEIAGRMLGAEELPQWLAEHAADSSRIGVDVSGSWGRGTGIVTGVALAASDGSACWFDPATIAPADDTAFAAWAPTRTRTRRCTTRRARSSPWPPAAGRCVGSPRTPRCRPTSPCPGSGPSSCPTWRCGSCTVSCATTPSTTASSRSTAPTRRPPAPRQWSGPGPSSTWPTTWTASSPTAAGGVARAGRAAVGRRAGRPGGSRDCGRRGLPCRALQAVRRGGRRGRASGVRGAGP